MWNVQAVRCRGRLGYFDDIVSSLACILTKQHGVRGGKNLLKTPGNSISKILNFKMSPDALALKNLCLWCEFQSHLLFIIILGDPGADSGDEGKSKRSEKCGTKKSKERREEPLGTMSYQTSSKRSPPFWLLIGASNITNFPPHILCLQVSVLIIHWHCFQVSYTRAQLAKEINFLQKELSITFRGNIRNMLIIGLCHR